MSTAKTQTMAGTLTLFHAPARDFPKWIDDLSAAGGTFFPDMAESSLSRRTVSVAGGSELRLRLALSFGFVRSMLRLMPLTA
jgi:hypothetical protein